MEVGWDHWKTQDKLVVPWCYLHPEALVGKGSAESSVMQCVSVQKSSQTMVVRL